MKIKRLLSFFGIVVTVGCPIFLGGCGFAPEGKNVCSLINDLPLTPVSGDPPVTVFEDPGTIKVMHGSGLAHVDGKSFLRVEQGAEVPGYANNATVFLNGWKLNYSSDHHVLAVATFIGKIKLDKTKLSWNAAGVLSDQAGDKSIDWRYWYTIVAWNDANLHAFVDDNDVDFVCDRAGPVNPSNKFFVASNDNTSTALSVFPTFLSNPRFADSRSVAILPRGFGFTWPHDDHHLLQIAYNMGHSETFIQHQPYKRSVTTVTPLPTPTPTGRAGAGFVSWNTSAIYKDNDDRRDYEFGELVSGMAGSDVDVVQPPFSILPLDSFGFFGACLGSPAVVQTEQFVVDNVPYAYAIPMLTGWDLSYPCADEHVREIGVWIDDLHYDKPANAATGTLSYKLSSVLHDDSGSGHNYRHKVTILGLRSLAGSPAKPPSR